jgi:glycosyltransferase involved in cell wall biosynthesis
LLIPPEEYVGLRKEKSFRLPCTVHCIRYPEVKDFFKINDLDNWPFYLKIAFKNAEYIRNLDLDILHGHTPNFSYLTNILGKMINVPTINSLHFSTRLGISISEKCLLYCQLMDLDRCLNCSKLGLSNIKERIWNIGIKKIFLQSANTIITQTELIKNNLLKYYKFHDNISVVPNWVDLRRFKFAKCDRTLLNKFKIKKKDKIILYCGQIYRRKGIEYLILAMPEILKNIDCKLLITGKLEGKDPFHAKIAGLINRLGLGSKVIFVGYFAYKNIPKLYSIADLFILPSIEEQQPLVLLEAMAARVPILTTSLDHIKEVIKNSENGILVKPKKTAEISKAAVKILKDNKLKQRLVKEGYRTVKQKFSSDKIMPRILKIYRQEIDKFFQDTKNYGQP